MNMKECAENGKTINFEDNPDIVESLKEFIQYLEKELEKDRKKQNRIEKIKKKKINKKDLRRLD